MARRRKERIHMGGQLVFADNKTTVYGQIVSPLGQGQFRTDCSDGVRRTARIMGRHYKLMRIDPGDMVLLCLREGVPGRADIYLKYSPEQISMLRSNGRIEDDIFSGSTVGARVTFLNKQ